MHHTDEWKIKHSNDMMGDKNPNFGKGHKQSGENNGHAIHWLLISPDNIITETIGQIQVICDEYNISLYLLKRFLNIKIPTDIKLRKTNIIEYNKRKNTIGWKLLKK
jgi:hypothetical protein